MASIFSTYSTGENRVTASFLAVLRALSLDRMQRLLGSLMEQSEFELIRFENQPSKGGTGVPDALIHSSIRILLETKIKTDSVRVDQLQRHLDRLNKARESVALLLVLTPDDSRPPQVDEVNDSRVVWASFTSLEQAIDEMLDDKYEVVSEREAYLLRELQNMLAAEGLLANSDDVVIVAARRAWPEYEDFHAYVCQPNRSFQQVTRIGFYSKGFIHRMVPKIIATHDEVEMRKGMHLGPLGALVDHLVETGKRPEGSSLKVVFLSPPDSGDTEKLDAPIPNDKKSKTGKPTAFTMGQRYVSLERLKTAKTTSDLD